MRFQASIATVPLLIYVSGFISSFFSNYIERTFSNKMDLLLGIIVGIIASLWIAIGNCTNEAFKHFQIYLIAILFGISTSIVKISTISLVSDMIGQNEQCISFIYGFVSFVEKISGGVVIYLLEHFNMDQLTLQTCEELTVHNMTRLLNATTSGDNKSSIICPNGAPSALFYKYILTYGNCFILISMLFGLISIWRVELNRTDMKTLRDEKNT